MIYTIASNVNSHLLCILRVCLRPTSECSTGMLYALFLHKPINGWILSLLL